MKKDGRNILKKVEEKIRLLEDDGNLTVRGLASELNEFRDPSRVKLAMPKLRRDKLTKIPKSITIPKRVEEKIRRAKEKNLTELDLRSSGLTEFPDSITEIVNLTTLDLGYNNLTNISESIKRLVNLTTLYLGGNNLTEISESITGLVNLTTLNLRGNKLTEISESIIGLVNLTTLDLSRNNLTEIPESITGLVKLTMLDLSRNNLTKIPESIKRLISLTTLNLNGNKLTEIPESITGLVKLKELKLDVNYIQIPPPEVVKNGIQAIKEYFRQIAEGEDHLYEAKLLIVGEPGAGKTSLARKIENKDYILQPNQGSTEGIDVITWNFNMEDGQDFRTNIWDFGGQQIYHATHQFFLTKRSFYVLVCDMRKEDTDFYYWLSIIELLSDNSPLIIVKNEVQDRKRDISERQLRGQFTNFKEIFATNLDTNRGLDVIISAVKHYMSNLSIVGTPLPKTWVKVREILEKDKRNHISLDEYMKICDENGFREDKDKLQLSGYLHDIGVCLHFQDDMILRKTVILKPEWGTDAVYKVLHNEKVINNHGKFNNADLASIWSDPKYNNMHAELLQLMLNFKLCYRIPGKDDTYIAPQLLTENQPEYIWDENENLILQYICEEFMPKGMLSRFIVEMHRCIIDENLVWKSGVILERDRTKAEVIENYGRREIKIRVVGMHKKEFITLITDELDIIHDSFNRLKYKKLIPCNCSKCKNSQNPHFYEHKVLRRYMEDRRDQIECNESYERVNVRKLIDDVFEGPNEGVDIKLDSEGNMDRFDVFLAHNSKDKDSVEFICNELRNRKLNPWLDKEQIPPGRWFQDVIQKALTDVKSIAIFIGTHGLGKWEVLELRSAISQCVERDIPVIPVLLPGVSDLPPELLFLKELNYTKFSKIDDVVALDNLEWGITGKRPKRKS